MNNKTRIALAASAALAMGLTGASMAEANLLTLQNGVDGYEGARNTWINENNPDTIRDGPPPLIRVENRAQDVKQGLIAFDNVFTLDPVADPTLIPLGATINIATLSVYTNDTVAEAHRYGIHRLLLPFDVATDTWNTWGSGQDGRNFTPGLQLDNVEAVSVADDFSPVGAAANVGFNTHWDVTSSLRVWAEGSDLNPPGWVVHGLLGNGNWGFKSSHHGDVADRPILVVDWSPTFHWTANQDGNWSDSGNWLDGSVPSAAGTAARLGTVPTQAITVTVDAPQTIGSLTLDNVNSYTVQGSSALTMQQAGGSIADAFIHAASGDHTLSAPLVLSQDTRVRVDEAAQVLTIDSNISGSGGLTKLGLGTVVLNGTNTYTGDTTFGGGEVHVSSNENLGDPGNGLVFVGGGRLAMTGAALNTDRPITILSGGGVILTNGFDATMDGQLSGVGRLFKGTAGTLTLGSGELAGIVTSGGTTLIPATSTIDVSTPDARGMPQRDIHQNTTGATIIEGTVTANQLINTSSEPLTLNGSLTLIGNGLVGNASNTGTITGTGTLTKAGNAPLTLNNGSIGTLIATAEAAPAGNPFVNVAVPSGGVFSIGTADLSPAAENLSVNLIVDGTLDVNTVTGSGNVTVNGTMTVNPGGPSPAAQVRTLTVNPGGTLDLTNNAMVVQNGDLNQISALVKSGFADGSWDGDGINSSAAAAEPGRALGVGPDSDDVVVKFTWAGDATLDGVVNISDLSILAGNWQQTDRLWHQGDFNYDGVVNISDLSTLAGNWQKGAAAGGMSFDEAMAMFDVFDGVVVPEPAALGLLGLGGLVLLRRRGNDR